MRDAKNEREKFYTLRLSISFHFIPVMPFFDLQQFQLTL